MNCMAHPNEEIVCVSNLIFNALRFVRIDLVLRCGKTSDVCKQICRVCLQNQDNTILRALNLLFPYLHQHIRHSQRSIDRLILSGPNADWTVHLCCLFTSPDIIGRNPPPVSKGVPSTQAVSLHSVCCPDLPNNFHFSHYHSKGQKGSEPNKKESISSFSFTHPERHESPLAL